MQIDHRAEIEKLTFRALALRHSLWRRANARNVSFSISVRWSIYIVNSVDKPTFRVSLPHRRSTTVSLETNPIYSANLHDYRALTLRRLRNMQIAY